MTAATSLANSSLVNSSSLPSRASSAKRLKPGIIDDGVHGFVDALALALNGFAASRWRLRPWLGRGLHFLLGGADFGGEFLLLLGDFDGDKPGVAAG
jgi:hypothetical protein